MVKIGITGGIGSGKSTVCKKWQALGAYIINADGLAKSLMANNEAVKQKLTEVFGEDSYHPDGSLNRSYLAEQAFAGGRVGELNAIVHPKVRAEVETLMENAKNKGHQAAVYEAALLLQNGRPENLDLIVMVLADRDNRLQWVKNRDDVGGGQVAKRMDKQQDFEELKHLADFVLKNEGTVDDLKRASEELYYKFINFSTARL